MSYPQAVEAVEVAPLLVARLLELGKPILQNGWGALQIDTTIH